MKYKSNKQYLIRIPIRMKTVEKELSMTVIVLVYAKIMAPYFVDYTEP